MNAMNHDLIATMLLGVLCFVLLVAAVFVFLALRWRRLDTTGKEAENAEPGGRLPTRERRGLQEWHRPKSWLAIRSGNPLAVQAALALHNPQPCSWAEGLQSGHERALFVSAPVAGWILVLGGALPEPAGDVDICFRFLTDLSRQLGEVQFFSSNPMLGHHAWARLSQGRVLRAYAWAGTTLWNQGELTAVEAALRLQCHEYAEPEAAGFAAREEAEENAERVPLLATCWSIDPGDLDARFLAEERGILGRRK